MRGARGDSRSGRQHRPAAVLGVSEPGSGGSRTWRVEGTREEAVAVGSGWSQSEPGSPSQGSGCGETACLLPLLGRHVIILKDDS